MVRRIYVEKKEQYAIRPKELTEEVKSYLMVDKPFSLRCLIRYDIENVGDEVFAKARDSVFSEPPVDILYEEGFPHEEDDYVFSVEFLPGQFDQRADSAVQCIELLSEGEKPIVKTAEVYCISGRLRPEEIKRIEEYVMNPVDSREASEEKPETLAALYPEPDDIQVIKGFINTRDQKVKDIYAKLSLAMTLQDLKHIQKYFKEEEKRDPTETEIRVLDTYWSDHCRHTTFQTELTEVTFKEGAFSAPIKKAWQDYRDMRKKLYGKKEPEKPITLMDMALLAMKALKADGKLNDQEESNEINACSIVVPVEIKDAKGKAHTEEWLLMFKNETHNHPTEIEPFGGAATCLGGAIRDPLSGRAYVYQAMRVTGAADPTASVATTLKGKLPQKKLVREAARGYSSYGNQVGLATGLVQEIYHPGYAAKRMEIGAVIAAVPRSQVKRLSADPGDYIILLGGRTGRDGIGGATGSSKVHTLSSIDTCGAEVQKGNPPTERKIQRLFRRPEVSKLIKVCNDFGAGGVAVAIGELADGLIVDLDRVPKKYAGLNGTELAISESQERMAVVVSPSDEEAFLKYAAEENLEATRVAIVTEERRLRLKWRGKTIVDISRDFLNTNGARQEAKVEVQAPSDRPGYFKELVDVADEKHEWLKTIGDLNECSQRGLKEMFDSSIGAGTVLMPFGGKYQATPIQTMVSLLPVEKGRTDAVSLMSYGFDPNISSWSPFHGAQYAVTDSVAKIVAAGGDPDKIRFSFQEYFKRMTHDKKRWSAPFTALLGAYAAQLGFGLPSIGGKDSMSGTFEKLDVPPTLVSFAVAMGERFDIISPELKKPGNAIVKFTIPIDEYDLPVYSETMDLYRKIRDAIKDGAIVSAYALGENGIAPALSKMAFGNGLGVKLMDNWDPEYFFLSETGNILAECEDLKTLEEMGLPYELVGKVTKETVFKHRNMVLSLFAVMKASEVTLEKVFPTISGENREVINSVPQKGRKVYVCKHKVAVPRVFIPVMPGTNCEYDSAKAFETVGAEVSTAVFRNLSSKDILESADVFAREIDNSQIIFFPGGFSAGDEPDGSAKFFAAAFRNGKIREAVMNLLKKRDGLILGICNGFQALIKLGLLPYGEIRDKQDEDSPTLTFNTLNRHISRMAYLKVLSTKSPWLSHTEPGRLYVNPASHGEGRFVAPEGVLKELFKNGQVVTQYSDPDGEVSMDGMWNLNGSDMAVEGIINPDGHILGKMCHAERRGLGVGINIYGVQDFGIFGSGVAYFL